MRSRSTLAGSMSGVGGAPVFGEVPPEGGGQDGALELLEQVREAREARLRSAGLLEDGIKLGGDAPLLVERWDGKR